MTNLIQAIVGVLKEDTMGGVSQDGVAGNNAGDGNVAGIGVPPEGEPGVYNDKQRWKRRRRGLRPKRGHSRRHPHQRREEFDDDIDSMIMFDNDGNVTDTAFADPEELDTALTVAKIQYEAWLDKPHHARQVTDGRRRRLLSQRQGAWRRRHAGLSLANRSESMDDQLPTGWVEVDDFEEGFNDWRGSPTANISKEQLQRAVNRGMSRDALAKHFKVGEGTIARHMKRHGLSYNNQPTTAWNIPKHKLQDMVNRGMSHRQMGDELGVHPSIIGTHLKKHGLSSAHQQGFARKNPDLHPDVLRGMADKGMSVRGMAKELGANHSSIFKHLRAHGIKTTNKSGGQTKHDIAPEKLKDMVKRGMSHSEMGAALGVHPSAVRRHLKAHGIQSANPQGFAGSTQSHQPTRPTTRVPDPHEAGHSWLMRAQGYSESVEGEPLHPTLQVMFAGELSDPSHPESQGLKQFLTEEKEREQERREFLTEEGWIAVDPITDAPEDWNAGLTGDDDTKSVVRKLMRFKVRNDGNRPYGGKDEKEKSGPRIKLRGGSTITVNPKHGVEPGDRFQQESANSDRFDKILRLSRHFTTKEHPRDHVMRVLHDPQAAVENDALHHHLGHVADKLFTLIHNDPEAHSRVKTLLRGTR